MNSQQNNPVIEAMASRRSIRRYSNKKVPDEMVKTIIAAGMNAPSAGNEQPWQFVVITESVTLEKIALISPHSWFAKDAPLAILVCGDLEHERHFGFWVQDCSAATQNMLLAAHSIGLGAVWTGIHPIEERGKELKALLGIRDEEIIPFALIVIGYPGECPKKDNRFKPERIHHNKW